MNASIAINKPIVVLVFRKMSSEMIHLNTMFLMSYKPKIMQ